MPVSQQILNDLEFPKILEKISAYSFNPETAERINCLIPYENTDYLIQDLRTTNEYLSGFQSENPIPFSEFYMMKEFLPLLEIENYYLGAESFFQIKSNTIQIREITKFVKNFETYFPELKELVSEISYEKEIVEQIDKVFNRHGEIKDNASPELAEIRKKIKHLTVRIAELFKKSIAHNLELLDEIKESIVDDRRVLAVNSAVRKRVKGRFLGTSKTGSISYIEPESVQKPNRELDELKEEEKREIIKILKSLTSIISVYKSTLTDYEQLLEYLDFTRSKAMFALEINGCLPQLSKLKVLDYKDAYHPLLFLSNRTKNLKTLPQTFRMDESQRIIIISGPNAGGKSITLKTIGLNQLMIQSGILIPVHPKSSLGFFKNIFTDIGDNQSIEDQLSTYSYRLKQMSFFIRSADEDTLLLVDEFGTGSDPELGGALAEVFFEEFYERKTFGVFTTHYTNIKIAAERLPNAINASMLFGKHSLEPLYKLEIGQSGSSFTFEVAEKNNIPFRLINRARKKVEKGKVNLDKTIVKLQQEKFEIQKIRNEVEELKQTSKEQNKELEETQQKIDDKLFNFQQLYDNELKVLHTGKKLMEWAASYLKTKDKKKLITNFLKWVEIENSKKSENDPLQKKKQKIVETQIKKELKQNQEVLKEKKKALAEKVEKQLETDINSLKPGDRVKLKDSNSIGTIEKIESKKLTINYGHFTAKVSIFDIQKI